MLPLELKQTKSHILSPCTYAYQGVRYVSFSETFAYILNQWPFKNWNLKITHVDFEKHTCKKLILFKRDLCLETFWQVWKKENVTIHLWLYITNLLFLFFGLIGLFGSFIYLLWPYLALPMHLLYWCYFLLQWITYYIS